MSFTVLKRAASVSSECEQRVCQTAQKAPRASTLVTAAVPERVVLSKRWLWR